MVSPHKLIASIILIDTPFPSNLFYTFNKVYAGIPHWERARIKEDYLWWFKSLKIPKAHRGLENIDLKFVFTFGRKRMYDPDNLAWMVKMLIDCMKGNGVFKDDTSKYIRFVTMGSQKGPSNHLVVTCEQIL